MYPCRHSTGVNVPTRQTIHYRSQFTIIIADTTYPLFAKPHKSCPKTVSFALAMRWSRRLEQNEANKPKDGKFFDGKRVPVKNHCEDSDHYEDFKRHNFCNEL